MLFKKKILIICITLIAVLKGNAQVNMPDIFDNTVPITWLGLDFSGAKLLGDQDKYGSPSDIKLLLGAWNDVIEREYAGKYNISKALHKPNVRLSIDITRAHNETLNVLDILSDNPGDYFHLKEENVAEIIGSYDFQKLSGLALMFNVESFNKLTEQAAIWITFVDLSTKEIILTERMYGRPGGSGLRNYWANSAADLIETIKKKQFEMWRRKFAR